MRRPVLVVSDHRHPHAVDECRLPPRSLHSESVALRRMFAYGAQRPFPAGRAAGARLFTRSALRWAGTASVLAGASLLRRMTLLAARRGRPRSGVREGKAWASADANSTMTCHRISATPRGRHDPVVRWRRGHLRAGCASAVADRLAEDFEIELRPVLELLDRGCPSELAASILAPFDNDRRSF